MISHLRIGYGFVKNKEHHNMVGIKTFAKFNIENQGQCVIFLTK